MKNIDTKRKEQIEFQAGSTRDGLIANCVPIEQAFMYEDGFKDGANWSDENPKEGFVSIDKVCAYLEMRIDEYIIRDLRKTMELWKR